MFSMEMLKKMDLQTENKRNSGFFYFCSFIRTVYRSPFFKNVITEIKFVIVRKLSVDFFLDFSIIP